MHNGYGYEIIVYGYTRPNFLDDSFEFESYMGCAQLRNMYLPKGKIDTKTDSIFLSFPERWLNIVQERCIYEKIKYFYPNVKKVTIKTHSVYIMQCTPSDCMQIVDVPTPEFDNANPEAILYNEMVGNLFNLDRLNVVSSNGIQQV
jgi:hypothetical protein